MNDPRPKNLQIDCAEENYVKHCIIKADGKILIDKKFCVGECDAQSLVDELCCILHLEPTPRLLEVMKTELKEEIPMQEMLDNYFGLAPGCSQTTDHLPRDEENHFDSY